MKLLTDTQSGSEVVTRDPSDKCCCFFKKDKNNIEERLLLETLCCVRLRLHFNEVY